MILSKEVSTQEFENTHNQSAGQNGPTPEHREYAGIFPRGLAVGLDLLVFFVCFFPITRLTKGVWLMSPTDHRWVNGLFITDPLCLGFLAAMFIYFILLESQFGATVGKKAVGLQVVASGDSRPSVWQAIVRNAARFIDGLPAFSLLGIYLIIKSPQHARVGDRLAGTRVLRKPDRSKSNL